MFAKHEQPPMTHQTTGASRERAPVTRRQVLRGAGVAAVGLALGLAGCATGVEEEPDADVVWHETEPDIDDVAVQQQVEVTAMVANLAESGAVEVIAETYTTGREEPLDTHAVTIEMDGDDQQIITFEMEVSPAADTLETRAEAV